MFKPKSEPELLMQAGCDACSKDVLNGAGGKTLVEGCMNLT